MVVDDRQSIGHRRDVIYKPQCSVPSLIWYNALWLDVTDHVKKVTLRLRKCYVNSSHGLVECVTPAHIYLLQSLVINHKVWYLIFSKLFSIFDSFSRHCS